MAKKEFDQRIEKLRKLINHHRYLYHVLDRQEISDAALDSLKKELFDLEQKYPELITLDSPTQRIGGKPLEKFKKIRHFRPMFSFNDAFSEKDMEDWQERISKLLTEKEKKEIDFFCELKIDGLAIELIYEKGILKTGSTRGDGILGEDIAQNLKTIEAIPLRLKDRDSPRTVPEEIIVRGEVFISKKEFEKLNKERQKKKLVLYANPRNIAAGSIRQLDPKITAKRRLDSFAYDLVTDFRQKTHEEKHQILKSIGFKINPHNKYCKNLTEVFRFHKFWQEKRTELPYEIDGIVVIVNSNKNFEKLGVVGKAPRGAIAFKFAPNQATTKVEDIKVQIGRTGALTPVAHLKPVLVGGVTISRATLHNEDEIKKLGVKIGDTVIIERAGDVIPAVAKVLPELRIGKEKEFHFPKICPVCKTELVKPKEEAVWRCPNAACPSRKRENLYYFTSKKAFDIRGLGPKIIDQLVDENLISRAPDIFELEEGDLLPLERFAERKSKNIIEAIADSKKIPLARFIFALGIRHAGEETAIDLANYFGNIDKLRKTTKEELDKIPSIGPEISKSIHDWFNSQSNQRLIDDLLKTGIIIIPPEKPPAGGGKKLIGKTFVFTGALETITREEAKEKIQLLGGEVSESISSKIAFLVVGQES